MDGGTDGGAEGDVKEDEISHGEIKNQRQRGGVEGWMKRKRGGDGGIRGG